MSEFVCLNCLHLFTSRKDEARSRACSKCKSRTIIDLDTLVRAVEGAREWLDAHRNLTFEAHFILIRDLPIINKILINSYFPRGLEAMSMIIKMANDWEKNSMSAEDHIILSLRRLR